MMGDIRFMISEAAKQVHVESHVLRYWEEELDLKIGRTEMGHRYYTEDDIQLFRCIRKLKNEGILLKNLKPLIPELQNTRQKYHSPKPETTALTPKSTVAPVEVITSTQLEQVRTLIGDVLTEVVQENNQTLEENITRKVTDNVLQEMDFLFQAKERQEEEHFRKLDCLIRQQQALHKESVKATPLERFRKILT